MKSKFIMESFWQHPKGYNCATVAIIKVAILHYGAGKVFTAIRTGNTYSIKLRNGQEIKLQQKEIVALNRGNHIVFSRYRVKEKVKQLKVLKAYVQLCYAVMIKYLNETGFRSRKFEIEDAREYLQEGFDEDDPFNTDHLYMFFGLKRRQREVVDLKEKHITHIRSSKALMLYSPFHVVAVTDGYYDNYGTRKEIKNKIPKLQGAEAEWWYELA